MRQLAEDSPPEKSKLASFKALLAASILELVKVCSSQLLEVDSKN